MGVPGLIIWLALNITWAVRMFVALRRARSLAPIWAMVVIWLFVYWAAMMVNASFDPYLQGPQGGIWFWAVIGGGLVAMDAIRRLPSGAASGTLGGPAPTPLAAARGGGSGVPQVTHAPPGGEQRRD